MFNKLILVTSLFFIVSCSSNPKHCSSFLPELPDKFYINVDTGNNIYEADEGGLRILRNYDAARQ